MNLENLVKEVVFYSIVNSFVTFGILQTVLKLLNRETIHRFVGLGVTYVLGLIMGFMLTNGDPIWQKILWGLSIGAVSVAIYRSAIQSLLSIIPAMVDKIFSTNSSSTPTSITEELDTSPIEKGN